MKFREVPVRLVVGSYVLHSGLGKWKGDEATAEAVHGMAAGAYPVFKSLAPSSFLRLLSLGEIAVGAALLLPVASTAVAGAALTGFSGALVGLYVRTPGMREEHSVWPTHQGIAISKDSWLLAAGVGLLADAMTRRRS
jgi:uncharacterized membrane protein YphA (DoxX/SURF4 family)